MYNVECPKCKAMNKNVDLYETAGWFECIECGEVSKVLEFREWYRIPFRVFDELISGFSTDWRRIIFIIKSHHNVIFLLDKLTSQWYNTVEKE